MAKFKVSGESSDLRHRNSVEINGKIRFAGEVLDESEFKPASGNTYINEDNIKVYELSELESLLKTKHVERMD